MHEQNWGSPLSWARSEFHVSPHFLTQVGWTVFPFSTKFSLKVEMPRNLKPWNPTKKMIESASGRSAWSNYNKKNIYTLQVRSISRNSSEKETFIAQARTPRRSQGFSVPQSCTREPSSSTREEHGGAAEGTWHIWRTGPPDHVPRESSATAEGNVSPSKEHRLWPNYFLSSDRFFP